MTHDAADQFRVFDRVIRHLTDDAAQSGLLVVLDDLHWADPDSLGLLEFAARQLAASRLLLVGQCEPGRPELPNAAVALVTAQRQGTHCSSPIRTHR
jgi:predicted ATPase